MRNLLLAQDRICRIAADLGFDFNSLDMHGCWSFNTTLYEHVYPEQPDFTAWDASDAAELAATLREVCTL
jgi:hypothetical protein